MLKFISYGIFFSSRVHLLSIWLVVVAIKILNYILTFDKKTKAVNFYVMCYITSCFTYLFIYLLIHLHKKPIADSFKVFFWNPFKWCIKCLEVLSKMGLLVKGSFCFPLSLDIEGLNLCCRMHQFDCCLVFSESLPDYFFTECGRSHSWSNTCLIL